MTTAERTMAVLGVLSLVGLVIFGVVQHNDAVAARAEAAAAIASNSARSAGAPTAAAKVTSARTTAAPAAVHAATAKPPASKHTTAKLTPPTKAAAVVTSSSKSVAPGPPTMYSVSLSPLCVYSDCSGTQQVGDHLFRYTDNPTANEFPQYWPYPAFTDGNSSCTSLTIKFAGDDWAQSGNHGTIDYVKVVQESAPTVYGKVGVGEVGTITVKRDGGPISIDVAYQNDPGIHNTSVLLDIVGSCTTPDGQK